MSISCVELSCLPIEILFIIIQTMCCIDMYDINYIINTLCKLRLVSKYFSVISSSICDILYNKLPFKYDKFCSTDKPHVKLMKLKYNMYFHKTFVFPYLYIDKNSFTFGENRSRCHIMNSFSNFGGDIRSNPLYILPSETIAVILQFNNNYSYLGHYTSSHVKISEEDHNYFTLIKEILDAVDELTIISECSKHIDLDLDYLRLLMPNLDYLRLNMIEGTFDICMTKNNEKICGIMILESKHHRTQDDLLNYFPNVDSVDRIVF